MLRESIITMTIDQVKGMVEGMREILKPDDDWVPTLFLEKGSEVAIVALMIMEDEAQKDVCANIMQMLVKRTNPDSACFVSTGWRGAPIADNQFADDEDMLEAYRQGWIPPPSIDPDKVEIVIVIIIDKDTTSTMAYGDIIRHPDKPPEIKKWKIIGPDKLAVRGRFGEAIHKGFEMADEHGNLEVLKKLETTERQI